MKAILFWLVIALSLPAPLFSQSADKMKDAADKAANAAKQVGSEDVEVPKANVRGRVFYEETGQPLRRAWIGFVKIRDIIYDETSKGGGTNYWEYTNAESVLTDDYGEFVMKDVEPGVYQAVLKVPGVLNPTSSDRESAIFQQFTFESGSESQIEVGVKRGGAVSGYVRYRDGAPLIGAEVNLLKAKQSDSGEVLTEKMEDLGIAYTDDRGYYRFAGLPEGEYIVMTSEPSVFDGSNSKVSAYSTNKYFSTSELKSYFPQAKSPATASRIQVFRGEELTEINIILAARQLFEVSGLVVGARDNKLIDGIEIQFEKAGETEEINYEVQMIRTTATDKEGRWKFKDLVPGNYVAKISEPSYRRYRSEEEGPALRPNYATSEHPFEVTAGENRDVIFRIAVEGSISGFVTVEGNRELPESITVYADMKNKRASEDSVETYDYDEEEARRKARGDFTVDDLRAGEYFLSVKASEGYYAKSITYQGKNVLEGPVTVKEGEALKDLRVVLSNNTGKVEGTITGLNSSSYAFVFLMPVRDDMSLFRAFLQRDSEYTGGQSYEIQAKPGQYYLYAKEEYDEAPTKNATDEELEAWVRDLIKNAQKIRIEQGRTIKVDLSISQ